MTPAGTLIDSVARSDAAGQDGGLWVDDIPEYGDGSVTLDAASVVTGNTQMPASPRRRAVRRPSR
jgi:hypothetical protein